MLIRHQQRKTTIEHTFASSCFVDAAVGEPSGSDWGFFRCTRSPIPGFKRVNSIYDLSRPVSREKALADVFIEKISSPLTSGSGMEETRDAADGVG
jgi:hypothetical protein